jgi:hypothetical protein
VAVFVACVFHDHSIKSDLCCTLCALSSLKNALCFVVTTLMRSMLHHLKVTCISKTKRLGTYVVWYFRFLKERITLWRACAPESFHCVYRNNCDNNKFSAVNVIFGFTDVWMMPQQNSVQIWWYHVRDFSSIDSWIHLSYHQELERQIDIRNGGQIGPTEAERNFRPNTWKNSSKMKVRIRT